MAQPSHVALHEHQTLRYVRNEVASGSGYGLQTAGINQGIFSSAVRRHHNELWRELKLGMQKKEIDVQLNATENTITTVTGVDYRRINELTVLFANAWLPIHRREITYLEDSFTTDGFPLYWELQDNKFRFWPTADQNYSIRFDHYPIETYLRDPSAWQATTAYVVGDFVCADSGMVDFPTEWPSITTVNNFAYECTVAGTTGGSAPTWPLIENGTVSDGTVTWAARGNLTDVPASILMPYALATIKAHFRQQDWQVARAEGSAKLGEEHYGQTHNQSYRRNVGRLHRPGAHDQEAPWIPPARV